MPASCGASVPLACLATETVTPHKTATETVAPHKTATETVAPHYYFFASSRMIDAELMQ